VKSITEDNRKKTFWCIAALLLALGLSSLFLFRFVLAEKLAVRKSSDEMYLDMLRTELARVSTPNSLMRKSLEEKIAILDREITERAKITPALINPNETPDLIPVTDPPFRTGIFEGQVGGYFHGWEAKIENSWTGIINEYRVMVFAGEWVKDPGQGFIAVAVTSPDLRKTEWDFYPATTKSGALRIVEARGSRLVIQQANDEKLLYFDVPSMSYVASLDAPAPQTTPAEILITAQPTAYPYPAP
jgi:hypothetical protein